MSNSYLSIVLDVANVDDAYAQALLEASDEGTGPETRTIESSVGYRIVRTTPVVLFEALQCDHDAADELDPLASAVPLRSADLTRKREITVEVVGDPITTAHVAAAAALAADEIIVAWHPTEFMKPEARAVTARKVRVVVGGAGTGATNGWLFYG